MATFPPETLRYLAELDANNNKPWFDANRARYDQHYVAVGKAFLDTLSARLKLPGKMMRIYRDVRFSKEKTPYKPHLDVWFTESEGWGPGLFARLRPDSFLVGMGCHDFEKPQLAKFRAAVVSDGDSLRAALTGLEPGGATLKRYPKGFPEDPLMLHTALHVEQTGPVPDDAVAHTLAAVERFSPVYQWLRRSLS
ncbi:hypothetical protein LBMAG42_48350 [Deltaproteobacteria bacterium]|nr:hypothetical protein LBMAG42_48350 [Deltaproteobacteria bacterium]